MSGDLNFITCQIHDLSATPEALVFKIEFNSNRNMPTVDDLQRLYAERLMEKYQNKYRVAQIMGITVKTLYNKLDQWQLADRFRVHKPHNSSKIVPCGTSQGGKNE